MKPLHGLILELPIIATLVGCNAEVGEQYTGESLLSLHGSISTTSNLAADTVPVLGFENAAGLHLLDGYVKGDFPTKFSFDVTELPPDSVFSEMVFRGQQGKIALGTVMMVPRPHPEFYEKLSTEYSWNADNTNYSETQCNQRGACVARQYTCVDEPCAVVSSTGDASLVGQDLDSVTCRYDDRGSKGEVVGITACYDLVNLEHNYREIRNCDTSGLMPPSGVVGVGTSTRRCALAEESGQASLVDYARSFAGASNLVIVYASLDEPNWEFGPLRQGYNVAVGPVLARSSLVAILNCLEDAVLTATKEYNAATGTSKSIPLSMNPMHEPRLDQIDGEYYHRIWELQQQCPMVDQLVVVPDPSSQSLDITLGPVTSIHYAN